MTHHVSAMLDTYPKNVGNIDRQKLAECIQACFECAQTCTACADACLAEDMVADLRQCIRLNLDCADVCAATGRMLSRQTGNNVETTRALLEACRAACKTCGANARATPRCTSTARCVPRPAAGVSRPARTCSSPWVEPADDRSPLRAASRP